MSDQARSSTPSGSSATRSLANSPAAVSAQASARSLHSVRCSAVREGSLLARAASTTMRRSARCAASRTSESSRAPASVHSGMVVFPSVHSLNVASDCRSRASRWLRATTACRRCVTAARVLVWCKSCRHRAGAELQLRAAGRGNSDAGSRRLAAGSFDGAGGGRGPCCVASGPGSGPPAGENDRRSGEPIPAGSARSRRLLSCWPATSGGGADQVVGVIWKGRCRGI